MQEEQLATEEQAKKVHAILDDNKACESKLYEVMGLSAESDCLVIAAASLENFAKCTCPLLKGFIHAHMWVSLDKEGYSYPVEMDVTRARAGTNCLLKVAFELRSLGNGTEAGQACCSNS